MSFIIKRGWGEGSQNSMSFKESVKIDYTGIPQQWGVIQFKNLLGGSWIISGKTQKVT